MEETIKNRVILILVILTVIFFMGTIRSCATADKLKKTLLELNKEKSTSWDLEQRSNELKKEKALLEEKLESVNSELENTKKAFTQEQLSNESLKEELDKVTQLKNKLEEDLKEALYEKNKSAKTKKQL